MIIIMARVAGIKYETDSRGAKRFVRIDLKKYGNNQLLEDFLDGMDIEKRKGEETVPLEDVIKKLNRK